MALSSACQACWKSWWAHPSTPPLSSLPDLSASGFNPNHYGNSQVVTHRGPSRLWALPWPQAALEAIILVSFLTQPTQYLLFLCRTQVPFSAVRGIWSSSTFSCSLSLCLCSHSVFLQTFQGSSVHQAPRLALSCIAWEILTPMPCYCCIGLYCCCIGVLWSCRWINNTQVLVTQLIRGILDTWPNLAVSKPVLLDQSHIFLSIVPYTKDSFLMF